MNPFITLKSLIFFATTLILLNSCGGIPGADARKYPADPKKRVEQNLKEGRGFKLMDSIENNNRGGVF